MIGIFEHLASEDAAEHERVSGTRAVIAAQTRVRDRFTSFLKRASSREEFEQRLALIDNEVRQIVIEACNEHVYVDSERVYLAATAVLGAGHPADCTCGFCENKGKLPGSKKDEDSDDMSDDEGEKDDEKKESSIKLACPDCTEDEECDMCRSKKSSSVDIRQASASATEFPWDHVASVHVADGFSFCECNCDGCNEGNHCESEECISTKHSGNPGNPESAKSSEKTAADVETGDTFSQERVDLPSSKDGLGGPSPKIDKGKSGDNLGWDLKPIDVPSKQHPVEQQQIHDTPDYKADLPGVTETGKSIDAGAPLAPELYAGDKTETWSDTDTQQNPVTSEVLSKWTVA